MITYHNTGIIHILILALIFHTELSFKLITINSGYHFSYQGYSSDSFPEYLTGKITRDVNDFREKPLIKSGTTTGLTQGYFKLYGTEVRIHNGPLSYGDGSSPNTVMRGQYEIRRQIHPDFFDKGDSGSAVFVKNDDELICIGLAIGTTSFGTTVVTPIGAILDRLNLKESQITRFQKDDGKKDCLVS